MQINTGKVRDAMPFAMGNPSDHDGCVDLGRRGRDLLPAPVPVLGLDVRVARRPPFRRHGPNSRNPHLISFIHAVRAALRMALAPPNTYLAVAGAPGPIKAGAEMPPARQAFSLKIGDKGDWILIC